MAELLRFYNDFQPSHYDLYIDINRSKKTIVGKTTIVGEAKKTDIAIHQKYLNVKSVKENGKNAEFKVDDANDAILIKLENAGKTELFIEYDAKLTDTMMGIYPSYYEVDGQKKQIIGTQFETNAARQAFPCVDEPEAKATFSLALKYDEHEGETTLSNMPEIKCEDGVHYFQETVRMSTYLVAFAFGELQGKLTETKSGVKIGVFGTKAHKSNELDFALDIAKRSIEFYEDYYQTPYPLPHSWQLALPDFSAGAMENWGLVTYREVYLMVDPDHTALDQKKLVATVIAHELAHQWFGDLVTMKWWDDLWLNESFANMMEYVAVDALEPDWNIWEMFQTSEAAAALLRDATDGVQSVHVEVNDPAEIDTLFDGAIVYAKGSRMLVMVRSLIGDDALRKGLKNYFAEHKYSNAAGADLWKALGEASGIDVGTIMNSWLEQPGYPVVSARVDDGKLVLTQKQFFIGKGKEVSRKWQIPLNSNYEEVPDLMADKELVVGDYAEMRQKEGKPFRLNLENNAHFIVEYDDELFKDILENTEELDDISELQLMQDLYLLAEGQKIDYKELVPLLPLFANSKSSMVNQYLYSVANGFKKFVEADTKEETELRRYFETLSSENFKRLGVLPKDGETAEDELSRPFVLSAALYAKNEDAIKETHDLFVASKDNLLEVSAGIRPYVLMNEVVNFSSDDLFDKLLEEYRKTADGGYKADIRYALTKTPDIKSAEKIVSYFEDADTIKPQDLRGWFQGVLSNEKGQEAAWNWICDEWGWLEKTVGGDMEFPTYVTVISKVFKTKKRLEEFKRFFEPKLDNPGLAREIKMDTEVIQSRIDLIETQKAGLNTAIEKEIGRLR